MFSVFRRVAGDGTFEHTRAGAKTARIRFLEYFCDRLVHQQRIATGGKSSRVSRASVAARGARL